MEIKYTFFKNDGAADTHFVYCIVALVQLHYRLNKHLLMTIGEFMNVDCRAGPT